MSLTDRQIRLAKVPEGLNQIELRDGQVKGLLVRVYTNGTKTWTLTYRRLEDERRRSMKLGVYPGVSLKEARRLAGVELGKIAGGADPQGEREERRARSTANTVAELAEQYLASYSKKFKRPKGYKMDRWQLDAYVLPRWGDQPVDQITKRDVRDLLEDLAEGKLAARGKPTKVAPRNLKALLSKMFDWGADRGMVPGNPAAGVKLPDRVRKHLQEGGRDRVLSEEEIAMLWEKLDELEAYARSRQLVPVSAALFRLILLTAQRPGEVLQMRWRDIEDGTWWVVPAEVAKNGESNRVYLSPQVRAILDDLRGYTGSSDWVLESPRRPGTHLTTVRSARLSMLAASTMDPWTLHDLRRTAVSKMRSIGISRRVVQAILNHKDYSVTAVYDRHALDPEKQDALTEWGRWVERVAGGGPEAQVVDFVARTSYIHARRSRSNVMGEQR